MSNTLSCWFGKYWPALIGATKVWQQRRLGYRDVWTMEEEYEESGRGEMLWVVSERSVKGRAKRVEFEQRKRQKLNRISCHLTLTYCITWRRENGGRSVIGWEVSVTTWNWEMRSKIIQRFYLTHFILQEYINLTERKDLEVCLVLRFTSSAYFDLNWMHSLWPSAANIIDRQLVTKATTLLYSANT